MPDPRSRSQNVLDLRRLAQERQQPKDKHTFTRPRAPRWHQPERPPRNWALLGRESGKFAIAVGMLGVLTFAGWAIWGGVQRANAATDKLKETLHDIQKAGQFLGQHDPASADQAFGQASQALSATRQDLSSIDRAHGTIVRSLPYFGHRYQSAEHVAQAADNLIQAGRIVSQTLTPTDLQQPAVTIDTQGYVQGSLGYVAPMLQHGQKLNVAVGHLLDALDQFGQVPSTDLPEQYRSLLSNWDQIRPLFSGSDNQLRPLVQVVLDLFASPVAKDELVIFQNNDELRATGGFAGTFLMVEFDRGTFKILDSPGNGPYALAEQVPKTILPPQPLLAVNSSWAFQDTNWYLNVPDSATTALDFYEKARGFRPDGVIYISPQVVENLLKITGPISLEHYGVDITSDNFVAATESQVEFNYDKAQNNPKQFLLDLLPVLVKKIATLPAADAGRSALTFLNQASQKNFLMYSDDPAFEKAISTLGWDGKLKSLTDDGLAVVDTNLVGGKTDRSISEDIHVDVSEGEALRTHVVTITRKRGNTTDNLLTQRVNNDFIRVYAPTGASFVSVAGESTPDSSLFLPAAPNTVAPASLVQTEGQVLIDPQSGTRITHESGRTVFGAWSLLQPNQTQTITFTYTTPRNLQSNDWSLFWQKQPGAPERTWSVTYHAPDGKGIRSTTGGKISADKRTATYSSNSDTDQVFGAVL